MTTRNKVIKAVVYQQEADAKNRFRTVRVRNQNNKKAPGHMAGSFLL
ncbi:hypothetical protein SAMN05428975_4621 [Mucilaginibacter sp. OK268]|nr:hypothetical protein SAMN05428975_4621 [Mucilaginibacter sp. OK268]